MTVALDIAKSVRQVHAVDADGDVIVRRQLKRAQLLKVFAGLPPAPIGIEACATAHQGARELQRFGHGVKRRRQFMCRGKNVSKNTC